MHDDHLVLATEVDHPLHERQVHGGARGVVWEGDDEHARLVSELVQLAQSEPAKDEAVRKCASRLQREARERERDQLRDQLRVAQELGREEEVTRLLMSLQRLVKNPVPAGKEG